MKDLLIGKGADPAVMARTIILGLVIGRMLSLMQISPMDEELTLAVSALAGWAYDRIAFKFKKWLMEYDWASRIYGWVSSELNSEMDKNREASSGKDD